jgi:hypothetical protein
MIVVKPKSQKDIPRLVIVLTNVPKFGHVLNKKIRLVGVFWFKDNDLSFVNNKITPKQCQG